MASIIGATRLIKYKKAAARKKPARKRTSKGYRMRSVVLSQLGYTSYPEYLASEDWKKIRQKKLSRFPECLLCKRLASQVHHMDYDDRTLLGLEPKLLVTLCDACHENIEFDGKEKCSLEESNKKLRQLASSVKGGQRWLKMLRRLRDERRRNGIRQGPAFDHKHVRRKK